MKPDPPEQPTWSWPYPQSWRHVFRDITALLVGFLAAVYLFNWLDKVLP